MTNEAEPTINLNFEETYVEDQQSVSFQVREDLHTVKKSYEYLIKVTYDTDKPPIFHQTRIYYFKVICGVRTFYSEPHSVEISYVIDGE